MQDFINIFNQILYLIKNNYLKKRIETGKIQSSFFFILKFEYFGLYLRIYITDPNFFLNIFQKYMQHLTFD